jgi:hypothetical protein
MSRRFKSPSIKSLTAKRQTSTTSSPSTKQQHSGPSTVNSFSGSQKNRIETYSPLSKSGHPCSFTTASRNNSQSSSLSIAKSTPKKSDHKLRMKSTLTLISTSLSIQSICLDFIGVHISKWKKTRLENKWNWNSRISTRMTDPAPSTTFSRELKEDTHSSCTAKPSSSLNSKTISWHTVIALIKSQPANPSITTFLVDRESNLTSTMMILW